MSERPGVSHCKKLAEKQVLPLLETKKGRTSGGFRFRCWPTRAFNWLQRWRWHHGWKNHHHHASGAPYRSNSGVSGSWDHFSSSCGATTSTSCRTSLCGSRGSRRVTTFGTNLSSDSFWIRLIALHLPASLSGLLMTCCYLMLGYGTLLIFIGIGYRTCKY